MKSWANNPRYMRAMQKIAALRPEHRAILQTVTADPQFADERMRKSINSMIQATANTSRGKNLALRKKDFGKRVAMKERDLDYNKGQGKKALGLGIANLGLSSYGGVKQRQRDKKLMDLIDTETNRYKTAGINRDIDEMDRLGTLGIHRFRNYRGGIPDYLDEEQ